MTKPEPPPEATVLKRALNAQPLSARKIAERVGISDTRLRHIVNGYQPVGQGQYLAVRAPDATIARIAEVLDVSPDELRAAGRAEAAGWMSDPAQTATASVERLGPSTDEMRRWLDGEEDTESGDHPPVSFLSWYDDWALVAEVLDRLQSRRLRLNGDNDLEGEWELQLTHEYRQRQRELLKKLRRKVEPSEGGQRDAGTAEAEKTPGGGAPADHTVTELYPQDLAADHQGGPSVYEQRVAEQDRASEEGDK